MAFEGASPRALRKGSAFPWSFYILGRSNKNLIPRPQRHLRIDVKAFCIQERASPVESWRRAVARGEP